MNFAKKILALLLFVTTFAFCSNALAEDRKLVVAVPSLPPTLEPMGENANRIARVTYSLFETLIRPDQFTGELLPCLAESWKRVDARTVEFTLRKGVKFHDGSDFTAEDVVFSFGPERFSSEKAPGRVQGLAFLGVLEKVEALGPYAVRVTTSGPDPVLESRFASRIAANVSAVSPDWLITRTRTSSSIIGSLYRNSDAKSTSTGIRVIFSNTYFATIPT